MLWNLILNIFLIAFTNRFNKIVLLVLAAVVVSINLYFVVVTIKETLPPHWAIYTAFGIAGILYMTLVLYLILHLIESFGGRCCARLPVRLFSIRLKLSLLFLSWVDDSVCYLFCLSFVLFVLLLLCVHSWNQYEKLTIHKADGDETEPFAFAVNQYSENREYTSKVKETLKSNLIRK